MKRSTFIILLTLISCNSQNTINPPKPLLTSSKIEPGQNTLDNKENLKINYLAKTGQSKEETIQKKEALVEYQEEEIPDQSTLPSKVYSKKCIICKLKNHIQTDDINLVYKKLSQNLSKQKEYKLLLLWKWGLENNKFYFNHCLNCTDNRFITSLDKAIIENKKELLLLDFKRDRYKKKCTRKKYIKNKHLGTQYLKDHHKNLDNKTMLLKKIIKKYLTKI